jgi:hypothetical protein
LSIGGTRSNHPISIYGILQISLRRASIGNSRDRGPRLENTQLTQNLLGDDPRAIMAVLKAAASEGTSCADLGRSLCDAAALRVARFGTANEHGDWETAHHVFTYCNAPSSNGPSAAKRCRFLLGKSQIASLMLPFCQRAKINGLGFLVFCRFACEAFQ